MKIILQDGNLPQVLTIDENEINLNEFDEVWDHWTEAKIFCGQVHVCIQGHKLPHRSSPVIDYAHPVTVTVYDRSAKEDRIIYTCQSPIIRDDFTEEFFGEVRGVIVSRQLLCEYGFEGQKYTVEKLRCISQDALSYWGESGGFANALSFATGENDDE